MIALRTTGAFALALVVLVHTFTIAHRPAQSPGRCAQFVAQAKCNRMRNVLTGLCLCVITLSAFSQVRYPVPLLLDEEYGFISIPNSVALMDTATYRFSSSVNCKYVIFDPKGKSFFQFFKGKLLIAEGYYINSLDTLKDYTSCANCPPTARRIEVFQYFRPLKNGNWKEFINGSYEDRLYEKGVLISSKKRIKKEKLTSPL
jgi:hypothetical protein